MRRRIEAWPPGLVALLVAYLALGFAYSILVPLGEAPDEPGHYNYARLLYLHWRLPRAGEEHESFQPPLYYALAAPLAGVGDPTQLPIRGNSEFSLQPGGAANLLLHTRAEFTPYAAWASGWHLTRLLSLLLGAVSVWASYRLGQVILRSEPAALLGAAALSLAPQFTLTHGATTNDALAVALAALLLLQLLLLVRRGCNRRRLALVGILYGLGVLAKVSLLAAGPAIAVAIYMGQPSGSFARRLRGTLVSGALSAVVATAVCGWWFVTNTLAYGEPLAWKLIRATNQVRTVPVNWTAQLWGLHRTYWLGYVGMTLPGWLYGLLVVPLLACLAGLAVALGRGRCRLSGAALALLGVFSAGFVLSWVQWTSAVAGADQARLLYPAFLATVPVLAGGALALVPPYRRKAVAWLVLICLFSLNLYALRWRVLPVFAPPARMSIAGVPEEGRRLEFANGIVLLAYRSATVAEAGDTLEVSTWWQATRPQQVDVWMTLRLVAADGGVPVWLRGSPSGGRDTTDRWPVGPVTPAVHRLKLPGDLAPGQYTLQLGLQDFGNDAWWPVTDGSSPPVEVWPLGTVEVLPPG